MDKQTLDTIIELARYPVVEVNGDKYIANGYRRSEYCSEEYNKNADEQAIEKAKLEHEKEMLQIELDFNSAQCFGKLSSLSGLCDIIKAEIDKGAAAKPYFVLVDNYGLVSVQGSYEVDFSRRMLYSAIADNKEFDFGVQPLEKAIITLQSRYVNGGDVDYIIELLARISKKAEVTTEDNGVTQKVMTNKGIALKSNETVRNRVKLSPFRTFMEIEQPESEYLLRLTERDSEILVSLIESDGGAWKLTAKKNIAEYLQENLTELIADGKVIVLQ